MKLKAMIGVTLASFVCANAFAMEINKGKLLSHTENLIANPKASFKEVKVDLKDKFLNDFRAKKAKMANDQKDYIETSVKINSATISGLELNVDGHTGTYIYNESDTTQVYNIESSVMVLNYLEGSGTGVGTVDVVELAPGGSVNLNRQPNYPFTLTKDGFYLVEIDSTVIKNRLSPSDVSTRYMNYSLAIVDTNTQTIQKG